MIKKLNKYINLSILLSILLMILGITIIIYPAMSLKIFSYGVSIISIVFGIYLLFEDFNLKILLIINQMPKKIGINVVNTLGYNNKITPNNKNTIPTNEKSKTNQ